jgi:hypothetical protein
MTENQIYALTRSTIFCSIWCLWLAQLYLKTKIIANLQLEAGFYEILWIRRSSYRFFQIFFQISCIFVSEFAINFKI